MKFEIVRQESYSRGELLLRTFFGWIYIVIPNAFVMFFLGIWSSIINVIAFFSILFTGKFPQSMFEYQTKMINWNARLSAVLLNMADGYPAIGLNQNHPNVKFEMTLPESLSRGDLLLKVFFGWIYVAIPHGFLLFFRAILTYIYVIVAWWVVLFTGKYPESMFKYNVETLRWSLRLNIYMSYLMSDKYPPFNGKEEE